MEQNDKLVVFEDKKIRRIWNNKEWYFSVVDVVAVLIGQVDYQIARKYWNKLSQRLKEEGSEVVTNCHRLKLISSDGKYYETDCANTESLFRIIQSIPSHKAEPFKRWLAQVGYERIQEIENPELAQNRTKEYYEMKGYSKEWIDKRLRGITIRQELTEEWKNRGLKQEKDFAILTNEISKATFGKTTQEYKKYKGIQKKNQNLRDHMNDLELIFTMLGEKVTTEITKNKGGTNFNQLSESAKGGGEVAGNARKEAEKKIGKSIISNENYLEESESKKRKRIKN